MIYMYFAYSILYALSDNIQTLEKQRKTAVAHPEKIPGEYSGRGGSIGGVFGVHVYPKIRLFLTP